MTERSILILEDNTLIAMDIEMTLAEAGHENLSVHYRSDTALEMIEDTEPAAALLDFNLGKNKTSVAVAEKLKDKGVPFVFLTGYTDATVSLPDHLEPIRRIAKPFHGPDIVKAVNDMVSEA